MIEVDAVSFLNRAGLRLFGTLHQPAHPDRALPVVVLLSPGVKMRVGPGRLYVPLTEMLCVEGYTVFRFDFFGLGDSEGELHEALLSEVYNHIEVGRYVDDTLAALAWLKQTLGVSRFIVGGLCGGAITAVLTAQQEPSAIGLLSLGMTVTLASNAATPGKYLTNAQLAERRKAYFKKLLSPLAWWRLLTLQSDYSVIWYAFLRMLLKRRQPKPSLETVDQRGNANPLFPSAYLAFLERGGRAFMLFSGKDRLQSEYEEKFAEPFAERLTRFATQIEQHIVPDANHVLALHEWQHDMVEASRKWITKHFPA